MGLTAVVLAAGRGSRLGPLGAKTPKALLPVGGIAVLDRILGGLADAQVDRCVVVTAHLAGAIEGHLSHATPLPVVIVRQPRPTGTGDALRHAHPAVGHGPFVFSWGDVLVPPATYRQVVEAEGDGAVAVNRLEDQSAGAAVLVEAGQVRGIVEKPRPGSVSTPWNNAGVGRLDAAIWDYLDSAEPSERGEIELPGAIDRWISDGAAVTAVEVTGPWFDIGTPEALADADAHYST
jgi:NDP-sugar pyrophosphorylase family protein